jgi:hypothetical protein
LRLWQIIALRATFLLGIAFGAVVLLLDLPAGSVLRSEAVAVPVSLVTGLVWFGPYQLGQLLGVRPPADRER